MTFAENLKKIMKIAYGRLIIIHKDHIEMYKI